MRPVCATEFMALFQPLGMLRKHRIHDLRECFVGRPHAMPARQQIPFEPPLTAMLAQHFHQTAVGLRSSSIETVSAIKHRLVASKTDPKRLESVSSGQNIGNLSDSAGRHR